MKKNKNKKKKEKVGKILSLVELGLNFSVLATRLGVKDYVDIMDLMGQMNAKLGEVPYIPFPVSFSTVDLAPIYTEDGKTYLLLGRKKFQTMWQFCGGFRDPNETIVQAARREFTEEASVDIPEDRFIPIGDMAIDDNRYRDSPHKITTHVYAVLLNAAEAAEAEGADDMPEVKWFLIDDLKQNGHDLIRGLHYKIFELLLTKEAELLN
jgi:ADP-ribose pyrophosphatase YjhB (NUDIX family)